METFSALLALCVGNSPVTSEFPTQWPMARNFDVFFDLRLNKRLSKQSRRRWFEPPSPPLWRHYNERCLHNLYDAPPSLMLTQFNCPFTVSISAMQCIRIYGSSPRNSVYPRTLSFADELVADYTIIEMGRGTPLAWDSYMAEPYRHLHDGCCRSSIIFLILVQRSICIGTVYWH